jgi:endonuclease/exonuclease/phosphatase (EEP) superfamily protein YafD
MGQTRWLVIGWGMAAGIAAGLFLRWSEVSGTLGLGVVGLTPLLIVPVVALAVSAWRAGTPSLRLAAAGAGLVYAATFVSLDAVIGCGAETSEDQLVIFDHNVQYLGGQPPEVAAQVARAGADVVVLQEVWPGFVAGLEAQPDMAEYRYRATEAVNGTTGLAVWSRWPLAGARLDQLAGSPIMRVSVESPHGSFALHAVHTTAPVGSSRAAAWSRELEALAGYDTTTPALLAGDFNATVDHSQFRAVVDQGWTDVHDRKGCGLDTTWPAGGRSPVSLLRLDHVLVTDDFEVLAVELGPPAGSDHRSVIATVRLAQPIAP